MPLSKKRQAEWMRNYRKTVIPNVMAGAEYVRTHPFVEIPNCPDRRYR